MGKHSEGHNWIAASAATLDHGEAGYLSLIGRLLAAVVATLLGAALILVGALGLLHDTHIQLLVFSAGVLLILLAVDQAWQATRRLG